MIVGEYLYQVVQLLLIIALRERQRGGTEVLLLMGVSDQIFKTIHIL